MTQFQKTISLITIAGAVLIGGKYFYQTSDGSDPSEEAPSDVVLTVQDKNCNKLDELRISPDRKIDVFQEPSFTLNDINSEIERESLLHGTETDRHVALVDLKTKVREKLDEVEDTGCPGGRVSENDYQLPN